MSHPARFNDGETAASHAVTCYVDEGHLIIDGGTRVGMRRWPLDDVRRIESSNIKRYRSIASNARLSLEAGDTGQWLEPHCRHLTKGDKSSTRWPLWTGASVLAVCSIIGIFVYLLPAFASTVVNLVPLSFEERLGRESKAQLLDLFGRFKREGPVVCDAPDALVILQRRAEEIATILESPFPINITIVKFPVPNALAMPGGQVMILSGLIDQAESGDEVIGVLAHEIAHVVRRDALQVTLQQTGTALLISLLIGDVFGGTVLTGATSTIIETGYSRDAEAAADMMAVTALNKLGLTARPLGEFLERLTAEGEISDAIPDFLSTHPAAEDRSRIITELSQGHGRALTSYEWARLQAACEP